MYTLDYDLCQLERLQDCVSAGHVIQIIHILCDSSYTTDSHWEDRYIVLIDCDPKIYLLLCLI
jgi:hypothetical protein